MNDSDLRALARYGPTDEEAAWAAKQRALVLRAGDHPWSRDDERLWWHYQAKIDAARAEGVVVRSHRHAKTRLGELAGLLED